MKKIMIIGAGLLQSYVIKRAKELGYTTICVDANSNAPGFIYADYYRNIDITNKEECLSYASEVKIDGVLTAATDYGVLTASYIAENMGLIGNSYKVCEVIKNKYLVRKVLSQKKIDTSTQFFEINDFDSLDKIISKIKFPVIVKPCDGSGSRGIQKIDCQSDLQAACKNALESSMTKKVLIESYIEGKEYGVEAFVHNGEVYVLAIMQKTMTNPPIYAELGHCSFSGLNEQTENNIKDKVVNAIKALGITTGSVNLDLLLTNRQEITIVDMGARMGGNLIGSHIVPLSTGIDYMGIIIKQSLGEPFYLKKTIFNKVIATRILALTPGVVKDIGDLSDIIKSPYVSDLVIKLGKNSTINPYKSNIDGCGYIVVESDNAEAAQNRAFELANEINKRIVRYL